jgi:outer membrane protein assembly factor BamE (lipoprotein component of BamABCDE complex)
MRCSLPKPLVILAIVSLILPLILASCGFIPFYALGKKFNPARTSELVKGESTREDVLRLFGKPAASSIADVATARSWSYSYTYLGNLGVERGNLEVFFKDNRVEDYHLQVTQSRD